jgi:hypothetical protein
VKRVVLTAYRPNNPAGRKASVSKRNPNDTAGAREATQTAEHADGKHPADIFAADRRLHRLNDDQKCAGNRRRRNRDAKGNAFDTDRVSGHQLQRKLILRDSHDGSSGERARHEQVQQAEQNKRGDAWHQHAQWEIDIPEVQTRADVARLNITIVHPENEDQHYLGHEQQAEKKGEAA